MMDPVDVDVLMEMQYEFPLTPTPYTDVAEKLDLNVNEVLERLKRLSEQGIVKRIGFYYNYRAQRKTAALVAFAAGNRYRELARLVNRDHLVTHNFLRNHPVYNVWIVVKRNTREELLEYVRSIASKLGITQWIALFSKQTLKLSVKYNLREGISMAGKYSKVNPNPPSVEDLGIPKTLPHSLRTLPLEERPYRRVAAKHGMSEEEVIGLVKEMLYKGVLGDPGAALEGRLAGFTENGMVVLEPCNSERRLCECISNLPYSTHVVLREPYPPGSWSHICYFMVHATSRDRIEKVRNIVVSECGPKSSMVLYSLEDLKPHVVR
ncbi:MAG: Lrp/AsnC family transcriptional regulator [Desulfurococcales archaeon]|nr:Lrp/AsnC family transcriptional regulator [Desulfurococcales archaeon]